MNIDDLFGVLLNWIFRLSPTLGPILGLLGVVLFVLGHRSRGILFVVIGVVLYFLPYAFAG